jgi:uncharacterized protein YdeI (YjbR/CyaY-like superfamily)
MPRGDGAFYTVVTQELRDSAGVTLGDTVSVVMSRDDAPRVLELPDDLTAALQHAPAEAAFAGLPCSHRKQYLDWILGAKQAASRGRRIAKAMDVLLEGKRLKG